MKTPLGPWRRSSRHALTNRCPVGYEPVKPSCTSPSCSRWAVRCSFRGRCASAANIASSCTTHAPITGARFARVLYFGWVTSPSRYFAIVLREADSRRAILLMLSLSTRCQRRILPIVSTQITPGRSANYGVCQAAHFYVIKQPQTCSVLRDNSHLGASLKRLLARNPLRRGFSFGPTA